MNNVTLWHLLSTVVAMDIQQ